MSKVLYNKINKILENSSELHEMIYKEFHLTQSELDYCCLIQ